MSSNDGIKVSELGPSAGVLLAYAQGLVPLVLEKSKEVKGFRGRWKTIVSKVEQFPSLLSQLSTHPYFSKNALCSEQLHSVTESLREAIDLATKCEEEKYEGKLRMQSDLDSLSGKLDLSLRDCSLFVRSGLLGETTSSPATETETADHVRMKSLLARLQIGDMEAKKRALESLMKEDQKILLSVLGQSSVPGFVQLLAATSPVVIREKAIGIICSLVESGCSENWIVSEEVLNLVVKLVDSSSSSIAKEKALVYLRRVSISRKHAQLIGRIGGAKPLVEICRSGDSAMQSTAVSCLNQLLSFPENHRIIGEEGGAVRTMIGLVNQGLSPASKEDACKCLEYLAASSENIRKSIAYQGGIQSLLIYLDCASPHESGVRALRNLIGAVSFDALVSMGFIARLIRVLESGSPLAQQAAASVVCRVCSTPEVKKAVGRSGAVPFLVNMLESKDAAEVSAQALSILATATHNCKEIKKEEKSVRCLVQLLDPSPQNSAKKYAVSCLSSLSSSSKKCRKLMISHGAIGYLKKLTDMNVPEARKLQRRLEKTGIFGRRSQ